MCSRSSRHWGSRRFSARGDCRCVSSAVGASITLPEQISAWQDEAAQVQERATPCSTHCMHCTNPSVTATRLQRDQRP